MATQAELVINAAEKIRAQAEMLGRECGYPKGGGAAIIILQEAYAMALVDGANYGGDPQRLGYFIEEMRAEVEKSIKIQAVLRRGRKRGDA